MIGDRPVGDAAPAFLIAEISANHGQDLELAKETVRAAARAGADAIKLQTYTADTLTIDSDAPAFQVTGTIWEGATLHQLYRAGSMPWEWHGPLIELAKALGLIAFSTPFDDTAVEFLLTFNPPAWKIASSELVDLPLIARVAATGIPLILSTGMGTRHEIEEAVQTARAAGARDIALLKCTAAYPAPIEDANLRTMVHLAQAFDVVVGLSDHTLGSIAPVGAAALGAAIIEKHFVLSRDVPGPDASFSMLPDEFAQMVTDVRSVEAALGQVTFERSAKEEISAKFRRSLWVVADIKAGETFTPANLRSIRPAGGAHTRHLDAVLGQRARVDIARATPLSLTDVDADI